MVASKSFLVAPSFSATATIWSALANRYVADHFEAPRAGRPKSPRRRGKDQPVQGISRYSF